MAEAKLPKTFSISFCNGVLARVSLAACIADAGVQALADHARKNPVLIRLKAIHQHWDQCKTANRMRLPIVLSFVLLGACSSWADTPQSRRNVQSNRKAAAHSKLDPRQEAAVLAMVEQHLPELSSLLEPLKKNHARQYGAAIRNLAKSARRLESAHKRGDVAYEREVDVIKAQTAINLLIAKLKVRDDLQDRDALRKAAEQLQLAELQRSRHEVSLMKSRLQKLQGQFDESQQRLKENESDLDNRIDSIYQSYLRKSGRK